MNSILCSWVCSNICRYDRKIARLHIGPSREIFTIHEDLLCMKFLLLQRKLQKNRNDGREIVLSVMTTCSPALKTLRSADQHVAATCTTITWRPGKMISSLLVVITLSALCTVWNESNTPTVKLFNFTSATQTLLRCVPTGFIIKRNCTGEPDGENMNDIYDSLVDSYLLGVRPKDKRFRTAILAAIVDVTDDPGLGLEHIREVYK